VVATIFTSSKLETMRGFSYQLSYLNGATFKLVALVSHSHCVICPDSPFSVQKNSSLKA